MIKLVLDYCYLILSFLHYGNSASNLLYNPYFFPNKYHLVLEFLNLCMDLVVVLNFSTCLEKIAILYFYYLSLNFFAWFSIHPIAIFLVVFWGILCPIWKSITSRILTSNQNSNERITKLFESIFHQAIIHPSQIRDHQ